MRRRGMPTPPPPLTEQQKAEIAECFHLLDADGSGALDADELAVAFTLLGYKIKPRDLDGLMAEIDPDGSGQIEFDEFASIMGRTINSDGSEENKVPITAMGQVRGRCKEVQQQRCQGSLYCCQGSLYCCQGSLYCCQGSLYCCQGSLYCCQGSLYCCQGSLYCCL
jgi:hypothetical protein